MALEDAGGWQNPPENADQQQPAHIMEDIQRIAEVTARLAILSKTGRVFPLHPLSKATRRYVRERECVNGELEESRVMGRMAALQGCSGSELGSRCIAPGGCEERERKGSSQLSDSCFILLPFSRSG